MFDIPNFWLFIVAVFLLSITPGPDMAYVVGQSVANGRRAGVISAAGVALGSCTHALASVVGLTALIAASPVMFTLVKYVGAIYLIYLGGKLVLETFGRARAETAESADIKKDADLYGLLAKDAPFAILAGSASSGISRNRSLQKLMDRVVGGVFIALGIRLALTRT